MKKINFKVTIIGGGYAGISILDKLKNNQQLELTLIDKSQTHLLQTHLHKYLSNYYSKQDITFDHKKYCIQNNIKFICNDVTSIDYENNYVTTKESQINYYDYLVVAIGMTSFFPKQIKNVLEYTKDIKNINNLDYYKDKFQKMLESTSMNNNIVIVGGGVSGIQIACEYAYTINKKGFDSHKIQVTIIEGMDTLLPGLDPFLIKKAEERCKELNINVVNNYFASEILGDKVILSNNREISYDMLLFVIGASGNLIPTNTDSIKTNTRNQLIVDEYYRVTPYKNVFAIGDITEAQDTKTKTSQTPTAQSARMQAELAAQNILNDINNTTLITNNISNKGILIDLGGPNCAVGRLFNFNISGKLALWLKKLIYSLHNKKLR